MQKKVIITGVLAATLLIGGGGVLANAYINPSQTTEPITQASVEPQPQPIDKPEPIVDPTYNAPLPASTTQTDFNGDSYPVPNDGKYHASVHNAPGIVIHELIFHEGFRAKGLKALDVHVIARSANGENALIPGQDEIVSATGSSGKVYNMVGSKGTGVTSNYRYKTYSEERIIQYIDVDESEKSIVSVVLRHDGKLVTLKPDANTKIDTTYATLPKKAAAVIATPVKVAVPEVKTTPTTPTTTTTTVSTPAKTIGKLTLYKRGDLNMPGDYYGEIVDGKAEGQGEVYWLKPEGLNTGLLSWKGNFWHNAPSGKGTHTYTDKDGKVNSWYTDVEGIA